MEHYCLDDEWTCLNTLCIPLEKHCDGHMNCYDHSDEHNCSTYTHIAYDISPVFRDLGRSFCYRLYPGLCRSLRGFSLSVCRDME